MASAPRVMDDQVKIGDPEGIKREKFEQERPRKARRLRHTLLLIFFPFTDEAVAGAAAYRRERLGLNE